MMPTPFNNSAPDSGSDRAGSPDNGHPARKRQLGGAGAGAFIAAGKVGNGALFQADEREVFALIKRCRVVKASDLAFWTGADPMPAIMLLEEAEAIERVGPALPAQHWRALSFEDFGSC